MDDMTVIPGDPPDLRPPSLVPLERRAFLPPSDLTNLYRPR